MSDAWVRDDKGNIVVFPLAGYETIVVGDRALALRLPFMVEGDQQQRPSGNIQFIIDNAANARELAQDILSAVERIEAAKA